MALEMEAIQHPRGDWVVMGTTGVMRPGVFDSEATAKQSMHLTAEKLQSMYVPMRSGGSPLTMDQIMAAFPPPRATAHKGDIKRKHPDLVDLGVRKTTRPRIMCWPHFPEGVTGQWSANTFHDEIVVPYIPAAPAEALIRELVVVLMDVRDFCDGIWGDADCDQDGYIPNAEMTLGQTVDTVLNRAAALGYGPEGDV